MKLAFMSPSDLPLAIIDSTKTALTLLARMTQLSFMSEQTLTVLLNQILDSLLDERLSNPSASSTMKAINKVTTCLLQKITLYSYLTNELSSLTACTSVCSSPFPEHCSIDADIFADRCGFFKWENRTLQRQTHTSHWETDE